MRLLPITGLLAVAMLGADAASAATNVALASAGAVATASVNTSSQALVNDGNTAAQGWVVATSAATIKVDWGSAKPVNQVAAIFANANSKSFKFQYWNGSSWIDLSPTFSTNIETTVTYTPPSPVSTVAVRLNFSSGASNVYVNELQAFEREPDSTGTNVALASAGGVATASTNTSSQARVNDGNTAAQGWGVSTSGATIKVDWGSSKAVNQVVAIFANANSKSFKFQYWNGSSWTDLSPAFSSNTETTVIFRPGASVSTTAVRLNFSSAAASVFVNELQAYAADAPLSRLKVVTWNLNRRTTSGTAQGNRLAAQNADLILTQEVAGEAHANSIVAALGTEWAYRYHGTSSEGVAVFYNTTRLTAVDGGDEFDVGPSSWGGVREAGRAKFMADDKTFYAFVAHLDWPEDDDWTDPHEEHVQNRNNLMEALHAFSGRKIFGGDLNARYTGNSVQHDTLEALDTMGVDSCFVRVTDPALDTNAEKHEYCDSKFATVNSRLDHLHATGEFTPVSHNVVSNDGLSDHKLVVAEFDIR